MKREIIESPFLRTLAQLEADRRRVERLQTWVAVLAVSAACGWVCVGLLVFLCR